MLTDLPLTISALMLVMLFYFFLGFRVGGKRGEFGVEAPAVSGNEIWERYFRVQQNTMEQLVVLGPASLAFAAFWGDLWGALACLVFLVGRVLYYTGYVADPSKRGTGMLISFFANVVLVIGALVGALMSVM